MLKKSGALNVACDTSFLISVQELKVVWIFALSHQ